MSAAGPVTFDNNVTLTNGDTGSTFSGLVTTGGSAGNTISGFDGIAFNGGLTLIGGPVSVVSNGGTLSLGGPVTGAENLTLNALAAGAGTVTGFAEIGFTSNLTALNVTAQTLSLPSAGLAVAGPMSFTAPGGITLNGAVGNSSGPATAAISFIGPVTLTTRAISVTTNNAAVNFAGTVNGAEALSVNTGTGTTTFSGAVGGGTPVTSLSMNPGDPTDILGGSIHTSGTQIYGDAVILGAGTILTGNGVQFGGTVDGAYALTVNDAGTTSFGGIVGGATPLTSLTVTAANGIAMNNTAVTTTAAQIYNGVMTLGGNLTATGVGITFGGTVDGAHTLTVDATTGTTSFSGAVGSIAAARLGHGRGAGAARHGRDHIRRHRAGAFRHERHRPGDVRQQRDPDQRRHRLDVQRSCDHGRQRRQHHQRLRRHRLQWRPDAHRRPGQRHLQWQHLELWRARHGRGEPDAECARGGRGHRDRSCRDRLYVEPDRAQRDGTDAQFAERGARGRRPDELHRRRRHHRSTARWATAAARPPRRSASTVR